MRDSYQKILVTRRARATIVRGHELDEMFDRRPTPDSISFAGLFLSVVAVSLWHETLHFGKAENIYFVGLGDRRRARLVVDSEENLFSVQFLSNVRRRRSV